MFSQLNHLVVLKIQRMLLDLCSLTGFLLFQNTKKVTEELSRYSASKALKSLEPWKFFPLVPTVPYLADPSSSPRA